MRAAIVFELDQDPDGEEALFQFARENVDDLNDLLYLFLRAAQGAGYTYVTSLTAQTEAGTDVSSDI